MWQGISVLILIAAIQLVTVSRLGRGAALIQSLYPSIHPPTPSTSNGDPRWRVWYMSLGSSHKAMPWEAQSDVISSREVPDGWKTCGTVLQLRNLSSLQHETFSVCSHLFPPSSWVQPWMSLGVAAGVGGSGIRPISQVHSIPWGLNKLSNQMNMQPTLRRWEKKRDRNVSFSECLSSLSALGTGWGPMSKNVCESI